jgi:hypothetical protein
LRTVVPPVREDTSWLLYDCWLEWDESSGIIRHKPLEHPVGAPNVPPRVEFFSTPLVEEIRGSQVEVDATRLEAVEEAEGAAGAHTGPGRLPDDIHQRVRAPDRRVTLVGYAVRLGYRVPPPVLISVGGVAVQETRRQVVVDRPISQIGALTIYFTAWRITYLVPSSPKGNLPVISNPWLQAEGGAGDGGGNV